MAGLTKREIDTARRAVSREIRLWDDDPRGFGVRIKRTGVATFFVQYTSPVSSRKMRYTLGQYGRLTVEEARKEARKALGSVARGEDPALPCRWGRWSTHSGPVVRDGFQRRSQQRSGRAAGASAVSDDISH
jgi:Arm DNA-binding domain